MMPKVGFSGAILEPSRRPSAIPSIKGFWCLPEMDISEVSPEDDVTLLQLMIAGEERGFVTLFGRYQAQVYRFSLHISGAPTVAEGGTQETFLYLLLDRHNDSRSPASTMLYLTDTQA